MGVVMSRSPTCVAFGSIFQRVDIGRELDVPCWVRTLIKCALLTWVSQNFWRLVVGLPNRLNNLSFPIFDECSTPILHEQPMPYSRPDEHPKRASNYQTSQGTPTTAYLFCILQGSMTDSIVRTDQAIIKCLDEGKKVPQESINICFGTYGLFSAASGYSVFLFS